MKVLLCILLLTGVGVAQERARAVEPIHVSIETEEELAGDDDRQFHKLFRAELRKRRDVAIRAEGYDVKVYLTATRLQEKQRFIGYAVAVLTVTEGKRGDRLRFEIVTGPSLEDVARHVAATLDKEVLNRARRK